MNADELLALGDPGVAPWVPLTQFEGTPKSIFQRCRDIIDQVPSPTERLDLLAVSQLLAKLRYNDSRLFQIFGGRQTMIESPLMRELEKEWKARYTAEGKAEGKAEAEIESKLNSVRRVLRTRFGELPEEVDAVILARRDQAELDRLLDIAALCNSLEEFRTQAF